MAIAPASTQEVPTGSAVAMFTIERLGTAPWLSVMIAETVEDMVQGTITAMVPAETSTPEVPVYTGVEVAFPGTLRVDNSAVMATLKRVSNGATIGVIVEVRGNITVRTLLFAEPVSTDLTGVAVHFQFVNSFGVPVLRIAAGSTPRRLLLNTASAPEFTRMATLMVSTHVRAVLAALVGLGVSKTPEEVQAAVLGTADNLESILASEFEALELERRAGTFVGTLA